MAHLFFCIHRVIYRLPNTKHYGFYKDFYSVNVEGTKNIVNYAKNVNATFIYISTLGVCAAVPQDTEDFTFNERHFFKNQSFESPYVKSKFEVEMIVMDAISNGLDSIIIRVGNLTNRNSDAKSLIDYESNNFLSVIKSFMKFGFITDEMMNIQLQFSPIDEIADGVVKLSKNRVENYFLYHLFNDKEVPFRAVVNSMEQVGIHLETLNAVDEDLMKYIKSSSKMDYMFKFLVTQATAENYKPTKSKNDFTKNFMKKLGFEMREIDQEYINRVVVYYDNLGYWKKD